MKIAVTYENGKVFQHFGQTERFKVYEIEDGTRNISTIINTDGSGHGALADVLKKIDVDTLICGGVGSGACKALARAGIKVYGGVTGDADEAVDALLAGTLAYNPDACCAHPEGECVGHHHGTCEGNTPVKPEA